MSEDEDDEWNEDNDQELEGEESPADEDLVLDLDSDVNLESAFLRGLLSDVQISPILEHAAASAVTTREMRDREPTEDDWENM